MNQLYGFIRNKREKREKREEKKFKDNETYQSFNEIFTYLTKLEKGELDYSYYRGYQFPDENGYIDPNIIFRISCYKKYTIRRYYFLRKVEYDFHDVKNKRVFKTLKFKELKKKILKISNGFKNKNYEKYQPLSRQLNLCDFKGALKKIKENPEISTVGDNNPLFEMIKYADIEWLEKLKEIKPEINVNDQRKDGVTPLGLALYRGKIEKVEWLLENGADPNLKSGDGELPIERVIYNHVVSDKKVKMLELLLKKGAEIEKVGHLGLSVLRNLAENIERNKKLIQWMVENETYLCLSEKGEKEWKKMKMNVLFVS